MLNLYKIPGLFVVCFTGKFGTGKTLSLIEQSLLYAENYHKSIVSSIPINYFALRKYLKYKKYRWCYANLRVKYEPDIHKLLCHDNSILLLDEAGLELFSRDFAKHKRVLFERLFKIRHFGNILLYTCQHPDQIDKQFRLMTHAYVLCDGFQKYSKKMRRSKLYNRSQLVFSPVAFEQYQTDPEIQLSRVRKYRLAEFRYAVSNFAIQKVLNQCIHAIRILFASMPLFINSLCHHCIYASRKNGIFILGIFWFFRWLSINYLKSCAKSWYSQIWCDEDLLFKIYDSFSGNTKKKYESKREFIEYFTEEDLDKKYDECLESYNGVSDQVKAFSNLFD